MQHPVSLLPLRAPVNAAVHSPASPDFSVSPPSFEAPLSSRSESTNNRFAPSMTNQSPLPSPVFRDSVSSNGSANAANRNESGSFETLEFLQKSNLTVSANLHIYGIADRTWHRAFFVLSMDARLFMFADYTLNARAQACLFVRESLLGGNSANTASGGAVLRVKGTTRTAISGAVAAATGATTTDAEWMLLFPDEDTRAVWMRAVGRAVNNAIAAAEAAAAVAAVPVSFPPVPVVAKTPSSASSPGLSSATLRQRIIAAEDVEGTVQILTTPLPIQPPEMNRKIESARAAKMRLEYQEYLERQRSDDQVRKREQAVAERLAREELERGERLLKEERERELKVKAEGIRRAMKMI